MCIRDRPNILFAKGCWHSLREINKLKTNAIGIDRLIEPKYARNILGYFSEEKLK